MELVTYPNDKVAFICGPQVQVGAAHPYPWFDSVAVSMGLRLGQNAPRIPPIGPKFTNSQTLLWENIISGTLSVQNSSVTVVGTETSFTRDIDPVVGKLRIQDTEVQVKSIESDTSLTLASPWNLATASGLVADTFYVDPVTGSNVDHYFSDNYYDLALALYIAFYRTGDVRLRDHARKVADAWWHTQWIKDGTVTGGPNRLPPRSMAYAGLMLRALDGRPEFWDFIEREVRANFDGWVKLRLDNLMLYYDIREDGYAQLYAVMLAKVLPDSYPLYANGTNKPQTGTATDGAAKRAAYLADTEGAAMRFFERLQKPDGSWRWDVDLAADPTEQMRSIEQPFMVGIYLESVVLLHQLSVRPEVKTSCLNQLTKAVRHLYNDAQDKSVVTDFPQYKWRGMFYFWGGGTVANPSYFSPPPPRGSANGDLSTVKQARHLNSTIHHAFGYAYYVTRDPVYKQMGDDLFDATFGEGDGIHSLADSGKGKDYAMYYRASGRYLGLVVTAPVPTPTPVPIPTPTPIPVPPPVPVPVVTRKVSWPKQQGKHKAILDTQWREGYRLQDDNLDGDWALFEKVR